MKEDVRLKMGGWIVDCPNCRVAILENEESCRLGDNIRCHSCHAEFLIEKITYKLQRVI